MLPTPSTSHVNYNKVYEPAEDSFLLLDTLSSATETAFLQAQFPANSPCPFVLEVGTGSGVVLAFVTAHAERILGRSDVATAGVDMNPFACSATKQTVELAVEEASVNGTKPGSFLNTLNGDLATAIKTGSVDVLIFNPPYVPSEPLSLESGRSNEGNAVDCEDLFNRDSELLSLSTDGGADGMEVLNRLLVELPTMLSQRGAAYILLCVQNKPEEVMTRIRAWTGGWSAGKVGSSGKKAGWEKLCVMRIWRQGAQSPESSPLS